MAAEEVCCNAKFWIYILIILLLVLFAGMMSGLTLGLMSLSLMDLEVLSKSGTPQDRKHAGVYSIACSWIKTDLDDFSPFLWWTILSLILLRRIRAEI